VKLTRIGRGVDRAEADEIQTTRADAVPLLALSVLGCLDRTDTLIDPAGVRVPRTSASFAVNGRYPLLQDGEVVAPTDGRLLLMTIDVRSRTSVGATLLEAAEAARWLGMVEAVNLDGGGSTTMSVNGHPSGKPSDGRERAVGDALV
jgi:hypothetical protein